MCVVLHAGLNNQLQCMQINKTTQNEKRLKTVTPFLKLKSKSIQLQNLTMYVTTHERKAPIDMLSRNKAPKTQQVEHYQHLKKQPVTFYLPPAHTLR